MLASDRFLMIRMLVLAILATQHLLSEPLDQATELNLTLALDKTSNSLTSRNTSLSKKYLISSTTTAASILKASSLITKCWLVVTVLMTQSISAL